MRTNLDFLKVAMSQRGKPYVFGASASCSDPDPRVFDCSELVKWSLCRLGVSIPDGAINQYPYCKARGLAIRPSQAVNIPGALMFKYAPSGHHATIYHVGITVGDGKNMMEAKGSSYGTNVFPVGTMVDSPSERSGCWNLAALAPGLTYVNHGAMGGSRWLQAAIFAGVLVWGTRKMKK